MTALDPVPAPRQAAGVAADRLDVSPDDVAVTLAVREDLGPAHEQAVIAEFLDRIGHAVDARVEQRVTERLAAVREKRQPPDAGLPIASLALGIPITAIASSQGVAGVVVAWAGIAAVNLAYALRR